MKSSKTSNKTEPIEITHLNRGVKTRKKDVVVREVPLTIVLNGIEIAIVLCSPEKLDFTPEEQAFLDRTKELRKETQITRLELALLEAKDAREGEIAAKAEQLYRLRGRLYALRAKNRDMVQKLWRHGMRHQWRQEREARHRWGMGRGMGRGIHQGMGHGMGRGMDHWMRRGMSYRGGPEVGRGMGPGRGDVRREERQRE